MLKELSFISPFASQYSDPSQVNNNHLVYVDCRYNYLDYNQDSYARYAIQRPTMLTNATEKRHCEFIAGRYCASQAIQRLHQSPSLNCDIQIPIRPDRSPLWPKSIIGSISHSGNRAMAVVGNTQRYSGLGIDCESLLTDSLAAEITDMILHPLDRDLLLTKSSQRQLNSGFSVTLAFSAKESLFKALSASVSNIKGFHDFFIRHISDQELILSPTKRLSSRFSTATEFRVSFVKQSGFIVTMAIISVKN